MSEARRAGAGLLDRPFRFRPQTRNRARAGIAAEVAERDSGASLLGLLAIGGLVEIFIFVAIVRPLSLLGHPLWLDVVPIRPLLGDDSGGIAKFLAATTVAVCLYLVAYVVSVGCRGRRAVALVLAFSALFALTLLLAYPATSPDIFAYIVDGRMAWLHGLNPMLLPRSSVGSDAFLAYTNDRALPSPYGPAWQLLLFLPTHLAGDGFVANVIAFRAISLPFLVGAAYLAARITQAHAPRYAPAAALLVGWSPLLLWEIAANGHNDMVMAALALFALERALGRHWTAALLLLTLSVLVKYITLLLLPLLLIAAWRADGRQALRPLALGALLAAALTALLFIPFWSGPSGVWQMLANWRASPNATTIVWSTAQLLSILLEGIQPLPGHLSAAAAEGLAKLISLALFAIGYSAVMLRLWWRRDSLLAAAAAALLLYLALASFWFWPWYLSTVVVLASGLLPQRAGRLALILSTAVPFAGVVLGWFSVMFNTALPAAASMAGIAFGPPFVYWVAGLPRSGWLGDAFGPSPADRVPEAMPAEMAPTDPEALVTPHVSVTLAVGEVTWR